tara:strand:+ start:279 stop:473 length:195 start_codon:yes stop_codon:yes gene_type:complete
MIVPIMVIMVIMDNAFYVITEGYSIPIIVVITVIIMVTIFVTVVIIVPMYIIKRHRERQAMSDM